MNIGMDFLSVHAKAPRLILSLLVTLSLVVGAVLISPPPARAADQCVHFAYSPWKSGTFAKGKVSGWCEGSSYFDVRKAWLQEESYVFLNRDTWVNNTDVVGYVYSSLIYNCSGHGTDDWRVRSWVNINDPEASSDKFSA